jgi:hypothetical protein
MSCYAASDPVPLDRGPATATLTQAITDPALPKVVDRVVTIGARGVNDADGRGQFSTVQYTFIKP